MLPKDKLGVIALFIRQAPSGGFRLLDLQPSFPEASVEKGGITYRASFAHQSSQFEGDLRNCDLLICWVNDLEEMVLPVLALSEPDWMDQPIELSSWEVRQAYQANPIAERLPKLMSELLSYLQQQEAWVAIELVKEHLAQKDSNTLRSFAHLADLLNRLEQAGYVDQEDGRIQLCQAVKKEVAA